MRSTSARPTRRRGRAGDPKCRARSPSRSFRLRWSSTGCRTRAGGAFEDRTHQLRRHRARHDRPRQAAAAGVRARLRQRLVPDARSRCRGTIAKVAGMAVTNVFGERTLDRGGRDAAPTTSWQRWSMFTLATSGDERRAGQTRACSSLPTVPKIQEGEPLEAVLLVRDEMANMVWGIETRVPLPSGEGKHGARRRRSRRAATSRRARRGRVRPARAGTADRERRGDPLRGDEQRCRRTGSRSFRCTCPNDIREIQLQRAAHAARDRGRSGAARRRSSRAPICCAKVSTETRPVGYDSSTRRKCRAPASASRRASSAPAGTDGRIFVWLGARKQTGRGERLERPAIRSARAGQEALTRGRSAVRLLQHVGAVAVPDGGRFGAREERHFA